ncbi:guanine deaminase [Gracilibacillus ureilyticus]|uniref:Guanine deaminase n=1 Tax=Gracilibacillus ureilyticus TaxID=531814 RepID=A0A1H9P760_9BACI|nr:nucleoside deaminase [Gracilibacillus ureilyticus]SER44030.1 guanine deaminase [Gracilibacillus ureilyticus]
MNKEFMERALELAYDNVKGKNGGPFAAIVVKDGEIVGQGTNIVTTSNDPTAHAEITAIRNACSKLNDYQLTDCEIYTSCEPCPMCLGAIYWARPRAVYYYNTREEAAKIGFDDQFIYDQIALPMEERSLDMKRVNVQANKHPFELWHVTTDKVEY